MSDRAEFAPAPPSTYGRAAQGDRPWSATAWRQSIEWIDGLHTQRLEMSDIARQNRQVAGAGRCRKHDIGESGRNALAAREGRQSTSNASRRKVEGNHPICVKMQKRLKPCSQLRGLTLGPLPTCLGNSVLDLRDGDDRHVQLERMLVHPPDQ